MCARTTFAFPRWIRGYTSLGILVTPWIHATAYRIKPFSANPHSLDIRTTKIQLLPSTISQFLSLPTFRHDSFMNPAFYPPFFLQFSLAKEIIRGVQSALPFFFFFKRRFRMNEVILIIKRKLRREFSIRGCVECFEIVIYHR